MTVIRKGQTECFECQAKPTQKAVCRDDNGGPPSVIDVLAKQKLYPKTEAGEEDFKK